MAYKWSEGDLVNTDERVDTRLRHVFVSEEIAINGGGSGSYIMSLMPWDDKVKGYFSIEFEDERDYQGFKKALAKALVISVGM